MHLTGHRGLPAGRRQTSVNSANVSRQLVCQPAVCLEECRPAATAWAGCPVPCAAAAQRPMQQGHVWQAGLCTQTVAAEAVSQVGHWTRDKVTAWAAEQEAAGPACCRPGQLLGGLAGSEILPVSWAACRRHERLACLLQALCCAVNMACYLTAHLRDGSTRYATTFCLMLGGLLSCRCLLRDRSGLQPDVAAAHALRPGQQRPARLALREHRRRQLHLLCCCWPRLSAHSLPPGDQEAEELELWHRRLHRAAPGHSGQQPVRCCCMMNEQMAASATWLACSCLRLLSCATCGVLQMAALKALWQ